MLYYDLKLQVRTDFGFVVCCKLSQTQPFLIARGKEMKDPAGEINGFNSVIYSPLKTLDVLLKFVTVCFNNLSVADMSVAVLPKNPLYCFFQTLNIQEASSTSTG